MTNGEKFKTAEERFAAFNKHCECCANCDKCKLSKYSETGMCKYAWLDLEYKEGLEPCPFCGGEPRVTVRAGGGVDYFYIECTSCFSRTIARIEQDEAIVAWNRRAK